MNAIYNALGTVMGWFTAITGNYYALALLLFALMVKVIMLPLSIRQQKTQIKTARLRPKMMAIEKKYAGRTDRPTMEKKQQEIFALQQAEGVSPMSGCLPLLIQLPVIIILYNVIQRPLSFICKMPADMIKKFSETFGKTQEIELLGKLRENAHLVEGFDLPNPSLFGIDLSATPSFANFGWLLLIPLFTFITSYLSMFLSKRLNPSMQDVTQSREQKTSMMIMELIMPLMSLFIAFRVPGALGLYWIYQSILSVVQMFILAKLMPIPKITAEDIAAAEKEMKAKPARVSAAPVHSLHNVDDDEDYEFDDDNESSFYDQPKPKEPTQGIQNAPIKKNNKKKK
ncbi:MAG: YidC/Oxa1 family membrane protein insertase [Clostridia bacterium]|nr:YidC/Oxa1 family membrane protein insertase [Clostridia bacterium]